jgi:hypothetical protein
VVTNRDVATDFTQLKTYKVEGVVKWDPDGDYKGIYDAIILANIDSNMASLGYTKLDETDTATPDIFLQAAIIQTDWIAGGGGGCCYYCGGWWYGYYPPCYPGWVATYTTGTILITMTDSNEESPVDPNAIWLGGINGLANQGFKPAEIGYYVDAAFDQSAYYLKIN